MNGRWTMPISIYLAREPQYAPLLGRTEGLESVQVCRSISMSITIESGNWEMLTWTLHTNNIEQALGLFLSDLMDAVDRAFMAGLSEPIFSIFEKAIADLSEEVNNYIKSTDVDTISINKEKQFLHCIDDIREELSMIKTVQFQQEEVWKDFTNKTWPTC